MSATPVVTDYTRVSDDASILCRRQDFPRAMNILQRRAPDHRRWRAAFQKVAERSSGTLVGPRRGWMTGAFRELVGGIRVPWLRAELAIDLRVAGGQDFGLPDVLPFWTPRDVWRMADECGLPMEYIVQVTQLPRDLKAQLDTAQAVYDFRNTAYAHREEAMFLAAELRDEDNILRKSLLELQLNAQRDAMDRWRALSRKLLHPITNGTSVIPSGL